MLNFDGNQVIVKLAGTKRSDYSLVFAGILLFMAVAVAVVVFMLPSSYAIAAIFALAVGCFVFNHYRALQKNKPICQGVIKASAFMLDINGKSTFLSDSATIDICGDELIISDKKATWVIAGFDNAKEMQVLQAVLLGQAVGQRLVNIKMQNNSG